MRFDMDLLLWAKVKQFVKDFVKDIALGQGAVQGPRGPQGKDGPPGPKGEDALNGANGRDGIDGKDGHDGRDGRDGRDGANGNDGQGGANGRDGADGKDGKDGKDGRDGESAVANVNFTGVWVSGRVYCRGDHAINPDNGNGYVVVADQTTAMPDDGQPDWQFLIMRGAPGRDGKDGKDGADGKDGLNGQDGADGHDGRDGKDGKDGVDGKDGKDGPTGPPGAPGKDGRDGAQGPPGATPDFSWQKCDVTFKPTLSGGRFDVHVCAALRLVAVRLEGVAVQSHSIGDVIATVAWPSGFFTGSGVLRVACAMDLSNGRLEGNLNFMQNGSIRWYDFYGNELAGSAPNGTLYTDETVRMFT